MKLKLVVKAGPGVYWPENPQVETEWGTPVAPPTSRYFLRDLLAAKATHDWDLTIDPLLMRLGAMTKQDLDRDALRLKVAGQGTIPAVEGKEVIGGLQDLLASAYLGIKPDITAVPEPEDRDLTILTNQVPRKLPDAQRAAFAVEALSWVRPASLRRRDEALNGGQAAGTTVVPARNLDGRSTVRAGKLIDISHVPVEQAQTVRRSSPLVFEAMLSGRVRSPRSAHRVATDKQLETEEERAEAIEVVIADQSAPGHVGVRNYKEFARSLHARKHRLPEPKKDARRFEIIHADLRHVLRDVMAGTLKLDPYDLCFADPMWGEPDTPDICEAIAELWTLVGTPGGILCILPGMGQHKPGTGNQIECAARMSKHLHYICSGSYRMLNIGNNNLGDVRRVNAMTLWFFSKGTPGWPLLGNEATSRAPEATFDINQRNLDSIVELLGEMGMRPGLRVLDPTACTGTTGVATIMLSGAFFTGIEVDPRRVEIAKARCSKAETECEPVSSDCAGVRTGQDRPPSKGPLQNDKGGNDRESRGRP